MRVVWSSAAWKDVDRIHGFLSEHDIDAADAAFDRLIKAPAALLQFPRRGSKMSEFDPLEVREFRVASYLLRYEIAGEEIHVLRFFHVREDRF